MVPRLRLLLPAVLLASTSNLAPAKIALSAGTTNTTVFPETHAPAVRPASTRIRLARVAAKNVEKATHSLHPLQVRAMHASLAPRRTRAVEPTPPALHV